MFWTMQIILNSNPPSIWSISHWQCFSKIGLNNFFYTDDDDYQLSAILKFKVLVDTYEIEGQNSNKLILND